MSEPHALSQLIVNGDKTSELLTFPYIDKDGLLAMQYSDPFEYLMGMERGTLDERTVASEVEGRQNLKDLLWKPRPSWALVPSDDILRILKRLIRANWKASYDTREKWEDIPELQAETYTYRLIYTSNISFEDTNGNECKLSTLIESRLHPCFTYCVLAKFLGDPNYMITYRTTQHWCREWALTKYFLYRMTDKRLHQLFYITKPNLGRSHIYYFVIEGEDNMIRARGIVS